MRGMGWSKGDNAKKILVRVGAGRDFWEARKWGREFL